MKSSVISAALGIIICQACIAQSRGSGNPSKVMSTLITSDINNFYLAFDKMLNDTVHAKSIFREVYFDQGSKGLKDFFSIKINDEEKFAENVLRQKKFYQSIRQTLQDVSKHKDSIDIEFKKFKEIYPDARFPDIYFVIGRRTSNGTATDNGLLIGAEVMSKTSENSVDWTEGQKKYTLNFSQIPVTVFHEAVHYNQQHMKKEKTLLKYAIIEGSAEFITELICGKTDGNYADFKGREKSIWADFTSEMSKNIYEDWLIENEPKRPRNAMYWAGYLICKSYYDNAIDKRQAVFDILHIKNYKDFYMMSKVDDHINQMN